MDPGKCKTRGAHPVSANDQAPNRPPIAADTSGSGRQRQPIVVIARAYAPCGRRSSWLLLVEECPFCSTGSIKSVHVHRGAHHGGLRRSGCGRGEYLVRPAHHRQRLVVA
jgi:hypothetical protein